MSRLEIMVLGPLVVTREGHPVDDFGYNKVRALLAYLAVEAGPHKRAHLCTLLWPDQPDRASRRNLSQALTQLRRIAGGTGALEAEGAQLKATTDEIWFAPGSVTVDAVRFLGLVADCERHAHRSWHTCGACAERLQTALALYRGDFLAGFTLPDSAPFEEWALVWRERLRQRALSALERLAARAEWRGALGQAAAYARRQVELDSLNETAHREAMRLLALNGELAAASAQFDQLRRVLASELAVEPDRESHTLHERLQAAASASDPRALQGLRRFEPPPANLPSLPNPLVGRVATLAEVVERMREGPARALTVTGAPGIGKTRLALEAAYALRYDFQDGVCLVELGPLAEAAAVPQAIAQAAGVREQAGQPLASTLRSSLSTRHLLLVLDNCEHVLEAAAGLVAELLAASPALKVLATSRIPLRIRAEQPYALEPLSSAEAEQLFQQRAGSGLAEPPHDTIRDICRRLDYLPLAIELVAVRARALAPGDLLRQLDQPLSALTAAPRDLPERHRSLRSALAWSYDRLPPEAQPVFRHLGVFAGSAPVEAVQAVASAGAPVLPWLETLHEASLAQAQASAEGTRFGLLETLREFALEQLEQQAEVEAARERHLDYFLDLAERAAPVLHGPEQSQWLDRLERDHDNLRAALAEARQHNDDRQLRLAVALTGFWEVRGVLTEGRRWLAEALERRPQVDPRLRADGLAQLAILAHHQGDYPAAREANERSLALWQQLEDDVAIGRLLRRLGIIAFDTGDLAAAQAYIEQSLAIAREHDDRVAVASALNTLALIFADQGDDERARALHQESLGLFRALGNRVGVGLLLLNLGLIACNQSDFSGAQALMADSLATFRDIGHKSNIALVLFNLGNVARYQANWTLAAESYDESLALYRELDDQTMISYPTFGLGALALNLGDVGLARARMRESLALRHAAAERLPIPRNLEGLGQIARAEGRPERAAHLFGAAEALRESQGAAVKSDYRPRYEQEIAAQRAALGEAAFARAWAVGRALGLQEAVALALKNGT
jgi:predicted ATPase/DNA-binding SARP family transcriptional activator